MFFSGMNRIPNWLFLNKTGKLLAIDKIVKQLKDEKNELRRKQLFNDLEEKEKTCFAEKENELKTIIFIWCEFRENIYLDHNFSPPTC